MKRTMFFILFSFFGYCMAGTNFPDSMPNDFKIEYYYHGGERQDVHHFVLQIGECIDEYHDYYYNKNSTKTFKITWKQKSKFEKLYKSLKGLNAFTLSNGTTMLIDGPSEYISYTINGTKYEVSGYDDGTEWKDVEAFRSAVSLISTFLLGFPNKHDHKLENELNELSLVRHQNCII